MAHTLRIDVRHWSSTRTARPVMSRCSVSRPKPSVRGCRPTATSTRSAGNANSSALAVRTRTAPPGSSPCTVQARCSTTPRRLSDASTGRVSSSS